MSGIEVALRGKLGNFVIDAAFSVPARGVTAIFGPSGCGKTTVLRCIAGLHQLPGRCVVAGEVWQDERRFRPAHQRPIGYVFQEASLFAHLSVRRNLLYGAPKSVSADAIGFDEVVELLGLANLLDRAPANLSGGERQRVAIGRALLSQPRLLLMDEPLAALDQLTKEDILPFLERLHARLDLPVIYVSHDMAEIERLADTLVLMQAGRVVEVGPLADMLRDAAQDMAASVAAVVAAYDPTTGIARFTVAGGEVTLACAPVAIGAQHRLVLRGGRLMLVTSAQP